MSLLINLILSTMVLSNFMVEVPFEKGDTQKIYYDEKYDKNLVDNSLNIIPLIGLRFYQKFISPGQGEVCNFSPSCSNYMFRSIRKYGILMGFIKGIDRLQRCNLSAKSYAYIFYDTIVLIENRGYKVLDNP